MKSTHAGGRRPTRRRRVWMGASAALIALVPVLSSGSGAFGADLTSDEVAEEIARVQMQADEAATSLQVAEFEAEALADELAAAQQAVTAAAAVHGAMEATLADVAVRRYMNAGQTSPVILNSDPMTRIETEVLSLVATQEGSVDLDVFADAQRDLEEKQARLEALTAQNDALQQQIADRHAELEDQLVSLEELRQKLVDEEIKAAYERRMAELRAEQEAAAARIAAEQARQQQQQQQQQEQQQQQAASVAPARGGGSAPAPPTPAAAPSSPAAAPSGPAAGDATSPGPPAAAPTPSSGDPAPTAGPANPTPATQSPATQSPATQPAPAAATPASASPAAAAGDDPPPADDSAAGDDDEEQSPPPPAQAPPPSPPTIPPPPPPPVRTGGGWVCPVQGTRAFGDTWGAARSGGRSHEGVDIMSPEGTPVVAVVSGSVQMKRTSLGGNSAWVRGVDGNSYFYAHLVRWEGPSRSVSAGEVIGYVGHTGNTSANHLHFEIHPGGGRAVNPYPTVRQHC